MILAFTLLILALRSSVACDQLVPLQGIIEGIQHDRLVKELPRSWREEVGLSNCAFLCIDLQLSYPFQCWSREFFGLADLHLRCKLSF